MKYLNAILTTLLGDQYFDEEIILKAMDELKNIKKKLNWLEAMESAGVDNWGGLDYAREIYREYYSTEEDED